MESSIAQTSPAPPANLESIQALVADDLRKVNAVINRRLHSDVALVAQIGHHIVHSGGKRLRPLVVLLSARALGYEGESHVELAAIVEFVHTATLLHDDVVDASALRRGQDTANALFGNEASVLVGDFLYSRAFQMMVDVKSMRVMEIMADTTNAIAEGEVLQLLNCKDADTTEERYLRVIHAKTARLFEAAAQAGAVVADASAEAEFAMASYGMHLGTAYQLIDDVLDYRGCAETIGKNVGDDLAEGKPTLPLIQAMRVGNSSQVALIRNAIENGGRGSIAAVIDAVESTGAITYTARAALEHSERAIKALQRVPESPLREALEAMAEFAVSRHY